MITLANDTREETVQFFEGDKGLRRIVYGCLVSVLYIETLA